MAKNPKAEGPVNALFKRLSEMHLALDQAIGILNETGATAEGRKLEEFKLEVSISGDRLRALAMTYEDRKVEAKDGVQE